MQSTKMRKTLIGLVASLSLVVAACGDDDAETVADDAVDTASEGVDDAAGAVEDETVEEETTEEEMTEDEEMSEEEMTEEEMTEDEEMTEEEMAEGGGMTLAEGPVGPACSAVPADGEGSFDGMTDDPAATAASNNPELSTLVTAVTEAGLVDTLNGEGPFTIFAPINSAFEAIPAADMDAVMADTDMLSSILTLHVVPGEILDGAALAGMDSVTTVNGEDITIAPSGESLEVNGQAQVVCANIEVANGVVHLIDTVLMPSGA